MSKFSFSLDGRSILVVGASRGIGEAVARALHAHGARVMLTGRNIEALESIAADLDKSGKTVAVAPIEMSDEATIEKAVAATVKAFGSLDAAVNNAGIQVQRLPLHELGVDQFDKMISINLRGVFLSMKYEIAAMLKGKGGSVVNVSSTAGLIGLPLIAPYIAAKHGVLGLTKSAALEYATQGIRVNALVPGTAMTDMLRQGPAATPESQAMFTSKIPMARIAEPEEMAGAVIWLCSDASSYVTGAAVPVDGGYTVP